MTRILAYLDPGSSSMILQVLLGGVAAAGVALKLYWRRFLRLFGIRKDKTSQDTPAVEASSDGAAKLEREPVETTSKS